MPASAGMTNAGFRLFIWVELHKTKDAQMQGVISLLPGYCRYHPPLVPRKNHTVFNDRVATRNPAAEAPDRLNSVLGNASCSRGCLLSMADPYPPQPREARAPAGALCWAAYVDQGLIFSSAGPRVRFATSVS